MWNHLITENEDQNIKQKHSKQTNKKRKQKKKKNSFRSAQKTKRDFELGKQIKYIISDRQIARAIEKIYNEQEKKESMCVHMIVYTCVCVCACVCVCVCDRDSETDRRLDR